MSNWNKWLFENPQQPATNEAASTVFSKRDIPMYIAIVVLVVAVLSIAFDETPTPPVIVASTACPADENLIAGTTYVLMDLSDELSAEQEKDLKTTLVAAATHLKPFEQINISRIQEHQNAPRKSLGKSFCSPDLRELDRYGDRVERKNCGQMLKKNYKKWHRGLSLKQRESIKSVCEQYIAQKEKAENPVDIPRDQGDNRSYIVGALEDIMHASNNHAQPARLIVFSDMLQNAAWFSQYWKKDQSVNNELWDIERLKVARETQNDRMGEAPENPFQSVLICYLRMPIYMQNARNKNKHREMWADYFEDTPIYSTADEGECLDKSKYFMNLKQISGS